MNANDGIQLALCSLVLRQGTPNRQTTPVMVSPCFRDRQAKAKSDIAL